MSDTNDQPAKSESGQSGRFERRRLPNVPSLAGLIPAGSEGGLEFARVVNLLLAQHARDTGRNIALFDDAAGDYHGLDAYEDDPKGGKIGYQYKFYTSPLSSRHRAEITRALVKVAAKSQIIDLRRWVLVLPDDLLNQSKRTDKGDLSWFEELRKKHEIEFDIAAWGHTQLLSLLLSAPDLCLHYYPEIVEGGPNRKRDIDTTATRYNENLKVKFGRVEFVGMSVYKQRAAGGGIPLEDIYVPLSMVPESAGSTTARTDTTALLARGATSVLLGDPGSGKTTLLRFLALVGRTNALRLRSGLTSSDDRLPILITLRRYADALRHKPNLSIPDYLAEAMSADYSMPDLDRRFAEHYLNTGRTVLLFDGVDELPDTALKRTIKDRICGLAVAYPGNTIVVTSRIVGYEDDVRFPPNIANHYRLAPLRASDIERFVVDWYRVRIEDKKEREENAHDLIRIINSPTTVAIRELAENPLLLTIIALVHRIDAVLPDERVVLYQKCTETLLNTWHKWKFRGTSEALSGQEERRNKRRIERIAYWMHTIGSGRKSGQKTIVEHTDLAGFLSEYISRVELSEPDSIKSRELVDSFLDFVKRRAGLLVEVGDGQYSFVHLTFQEYLAANDIAARSEAGGIARGLNKLAHQAAIPRWHEVIRLLVAALRSDRSQEIIVDRLLADERREPSRPRALLLGGLLLDGIPAAVERVLELLEGMVASVRLRHRALQPYSSHKPNSDMATCAAEPNRPSGADVHRTPTRPGST